MESNKNKDSVDVDLKRVIKSFAISSAPIWVKFFRRVILQYGILLFSRNWYTNSLIIHYGKGFKKAHSIVDVALYKLVYHGIKPKMVVAVLGIMFFKNIVNSTNGLHVFLKNLVDSGLPIELIIIVACALISYPLASTQPSVAILLSNDIALSSKLMNSDCYMPCSFYVSAFVFLLYFATSYVSGINLRIF